MLNKYTGNTFSFAAGVGGWAAGSAEATVTADSPNNELDCTISQVGRFVRDPGSGYIKAGRRYRYSVSIRNFAGVGGAQINIQTAGINQPIRSSISADGAYSAEFTAAGDSQGVIFVQASGTSVAFSIYQPSIVELGPIVKPVLMPAVPVITDSGANKIWGFHTAIPITESRIRRVPITRTLLHSDISSTAASTTVAGGNVLPPGWILAEQHIRVITAFDAGITLSTGIAGTPGRFVSSRSLAGAGFFRDTSASLVPESATNSTTVYWQKSGATTQGQMEITLILERIF
jgi:hypothetical protein